MTFDSDRAERDARRLIGAGAAGVALGVVLSVLALEQAGALVTVTSLLALIAGIHRFGRSGPASPEEHGRRRRRKAL